MTVIAAVVDGKRRVWMASDRQQTLNGGSATWPSQPKVQRHRIGRTGGRSSSRGELLIAVCGAASTANLVRHERIQLPAAPPVPEVLTRRSVYLSAGGTRRATDAELAEAAERRLRDLDRWAFDVAAAITEGCAELSAKGEKGDEDAGPVAPFDGGLLGYDGRLWSLGPYNALPMLRGWEAIGSGGFVATGALAVQVAQGRAAGDPEDVVRLAVQVAIENDAHCSGPVDVEFLEPVL